MPHRDNTSVQLIRLTSLTTSYQYALGSLRSLSGAAPASQILAKVNQDDLLVF
jgi:hypothetical protein